GKERLTPPEAWALGSEVALDGDMGLAELKDYSASKRAVAARARIYYCSNDHVYGHIDPSSFHAAMGEGAMCAETAVGIALFFIKRGFKYVPVTLTGLAVLNFFRFRYGNNAADEVTAAAE